MAERSGHVRHSPIWKHALALLSIPVLLLSGCGNSDQGGSAAPSSSAGFDAAAYFKGKTIRFIVSHDAGGGADQAGRAFAGALGDLLPGKPRVTVTNNPGMSGIRDALDAPESDLVVGVTSLGANLYQPILDPENTYDPKGVQIIGGVSPEPRGALVAGDFAKQYPAMMDAIGKTDAPIRFAGTVGGPADVISESMLAPWVCEHLKLPCDMISVAGDTSADTELMLQRGEVNSNFTSIGAISRSHRSIIDDRSGYVAFTYEDTSSTINYPQGLAPAPHLVDLIPADAKAQWDLIQPLVTGGGIGKTFWMGASAPKDVVAAIRQAYTDFTKDPKLYDPFIKAQAGGGSEGGITFELTPVLGDDGQKLYDASTDTFLSNREEYGKIQSELYDKYWKK